MKESQYKSLRIVRRHGFPKVEIVEDAKRPAIIEVTSAHNRKATPFDHSHCALAVATCEAMKADGVIIGLTTSYVIFGKRAVRYHNTDTVSREVVSFDRKGGFDVGYYHLSPFRGTSALGNHVGHKHTNNKGIRKETYRHYTKNVRATLK